MSAQKSPQKSLPRTSLVQSNKKSYSSRVRLVEVLPKVNSTTVKPPPVNMKPKNAGLKRYYTTSVKDLMITKPEVDKAPSKMSTKTQLPNTPMKARPESPTYLMQTELEFRGRLGFTQ